MPSWRRIARRAVMAACLRLAFICSAIAYAVNPDRDRPKR
jgi:hypothetical protein